MRELLEIKDHYQPIRFSSISVLKNEVTSLLSLGKEEGWICDNEYRFILNMHPVLPAIYGLQKVHKSMSNPPMRPIVSSLGSLLEPLSKYVDFFLKPMVQKQRSYLKDTAHIISIFEGQGFNRVTQLLVTLDIESLYTNIPQDDTIRVISSMLDEEEPIGGNKDFIVACISMVLKNNIFLFKDELYRQTKGTSMGAVRNGGL